jgi:hypothetical protein
MGEISHLLSSHQPQVSSIDSGSICIGDINRMCSQEGRGGGTVCVTDASDELWGSFNDAITSVEDCWAYNPCAGSSTQCYWCPSKPPTMKPTSQPTVPVVPSVSAAPSVQVDVLVGDLALVLVDSGQVKPPRPLSLVSL